MTGRIQLASNVDDLEESIAFFGKLFGAEPAKVRAGYANFAIADPPLKLILMENRGQGGRLNHLGVEVDGTEAVDAEQRRLAGVGLASIDERDTTCCYARQDKFWVEGTPDGERWEIYTVLEDSPTFWARTASSARKPPRLPSRPARQRLQRPCSAAGRWRVQASPGPPAPAGSLSASRATGWSEPADAQSDARHAPAADPC